jgi:hypothetical protein
MKRSGVPRRFAEFVEREVRESERNSVPTLNDLPPWMVEEAKLVWRRGRLIPALDYLHFFVDGQDTADVMAFCEEVIAGGAEAATWRIADCLVGVAEKAREAITYTIENYLATLNGVAGERWFRSRRKDECLQVFSPAGTGPGTLIRAMRYWTPFEVPNIDAPIRRLAIDPALGSVERVPDGEMDIEIRRWMASAAAWWARDYLGAEAPHATVEGIVAAYTEPAVPSADGLVALRALVREARLGDPRWPGQAGFIGPDGWYRP